MSLIDTACARVAISQHATPPRVEDCQRRIEALRTESEILEREIAIGLEHADRHAGVTGQLVEQEKELAELTGFWQREKGIVDKILEVRAKLRPPAPAPAAKAAPSPSSAPAAVPAATPAAPAAAPRGSRRCPPLPAAPTEPPPDRDALLAELRGLEKTAF